MPFFAQKYCIHYILYFIILSCQLSKQYGSVFSIQMGGVKMVVLSGYETVKNALVDYADEFAERPHIPMFEDMNKGFGMFIVHS